MIPKDIQKQALAWLAKLNSPELTEAKEAEFFAWLEASPVHQAAYVRAEDLWTRGDVLRRVSAEEAIKPALFTWRFPVAAMAATLMIAACMFFLLPLGNENTTYVASTKVGEQKSLILEDGSKVLLNTNSSIQVALQKERRVAYLDKGEAFFDVQPDAARPFEVHVETGVVRVLGTRFAVRTGSDTSSNTDTLVTVVEGKVGLLQADDQLPKTTLTENEQLTLGAAFAGAQPRTVDANALTAWQKKRLVFDGEKLRDVVQEINRYFDTQLSIANDALADKEVIAVIQIKDQEATHAALAKTLNLAVNASADPAVLELEEIAQ